MSLRDISIILRKNQASHGIAITKDNGNGNNNDSNDINIKYPNQIATLACKLFFEGKKPFEVAIELGIRETQVNKFFREFWKLKNLNELYEIYPQIRHYLPSFLKLHRVLKRKGLTASNVEWFANAIEIGAIKLQELQGQHKSLQNEIQDMQRQKQELERELQVINSRITELSDVEKIHQQNFDTLGDKICDLQNQKHQLEQFAYRFKNSNRKYLEIKSIVEEQVNRLLTEQGGLLNSVLLAVVEALRMNPDRYAVIYNTIYDNDDSSSSIATAIPAPYPKPYQNYHYKEYHEGILEIANSFLKILTNQMVDKTMVAAVQENV
jgi:hypothetical protein